MAKIAQADKVDRMKALFKLCELEYIEDLSPRRNGKRAIDKLQIQADTWEREVQLELNDKTKISLLNSCLWCKNMMLRIYELI